MFDVCSKELSISLLNVDLCSKFVTQLYESPLCAEANLNILVDKARELQTNLLTSTCRPRTTILPHLDLQHLLRTAINVLGTSILPIARKNRFETLEKSPFELRKLPSKKMTKFILVAGGVIS